MILLENKLLYEIANFLFLQYFKEAAKAVIKGIPARGGKLC